MALDLKVPYLKSLQGYLWKRGYESGLLKCPLFPDVYPSLLSWTSSKPSIKVIIYSSGSVAAQKLLFQYTTVGDLRDLIGGYFDTVNAGSKVEKESYEKIWKQSGLEGDREEIGKWLFLSDNVKEVKAAKEAGMMAWVVVREGNAELSDDEKEGEVLIRSFEEVKLKGVAKAEANGNGEMAHEKAREVHFSEEEKEETTAEDDEIDKRTETEAEEYDLSGTKRKLSEAEDDNTADTKLEKKSRVEAEAEKK